MLQVARAQPLRTQRSAVVTGSSRKGETTRVQVEPLDEEMSAHTTDLLTSFPCCSASCCSDRKACHPCVRKVRGSRWGFKHTIEPFTHQLGLDLMPANMQVWTCSISLEQQTAAMTSRLSSCVKRSHTQTLSLSVQQQRYLKSRHLDHPRFTMLYTFGAHVTAVHWLDPVDTSTCISSNAFCRSPGKCLRQDRVA